MNTTSDLLAKFDPEKWLQSLIQAMPDDEPEPAAIPPPPAHHTLPPFVLDGVHPQVRNAHAAVMNWLEAARSRSARPYWLSLLGVCGCGKTHLLRLAHHTLKYRGCRSQIWPWRRVLDSLRSGASDLMRHLQGIPYLLIDDIGAEFTASEKALGFSLSTLCELWESRHNRWTMLTSNLLLKDFADADTRVASRLIRNHNQIVILDQAQDFALSQYKARQPHSNVTGKN